MRFLHLSLLLSLLVSGSPAGAVTTAPAATPPQTLSTTSLSPFKARYSSRYKLGFLSFDIDADRTLQQLADNSWQLQFSASASAASLDEVTHFTLTNGKIQPLEYSLKGAGLIQEDDRAFRFDHKAKTVLNSLSSDIFKNQWHDQIQDRLSYMLQISLDVAAGKRQLEYPVFEKNKIKMHHYEVVGEETLNTRIGPLRTVKVRQVRQDKRSITAWLAIDHQYVLVKLADKQNNNTRYAIDLVSLED